VARPLFLSLLFGLALGGVFAAVWLGLERAWTQRTTQAVAIVAGAGAPAGVAAALMASRLAARPFTWRFAAAFFSLVVGTFGFASLGLFAHALSRTAMPDDSLAHAAFFVLVTAAGAAYAFSGLGAQLVLLPGLPLIVLFAALLARAKP
jgi:hypothetical protein